MSSTSSAGGDCAPNQRVYIAQDGTGGSIGYCCCHGALMHVRRITVLFWIQIQQGRLQRRGPLKNLRRLIEVVELCRCSCTIAAIGCGGG